MAYELNNRKKYIVSDGSVSNEPTYENFITPELRGYFAPNTDPLFLCFKLMVDYNKPYGLLAPESVTDSALAYLKRIGETERYEILKVWINTLAGFIKNYDFLIQGVEGIDTIVNAKPHEVFKEDDKITFMIRETHDFMLQSLLTQYRHIWFDDVRGVEVLPANLRRFDINILIYNSGYYNMALYDVMENNGLTKENNPETQMFPTLKKLSDKFFVPNAQSYGFNHHLIYVKDAQINNEESGKSFFTSVTNDGPGDMVKNTLSLNFRFAGYSGTFNNIFGNFDIVKLLAVSAAQDRVSNEADFNVLSKLKSDMQTALKNTKEVFESNVKDASNSLKNKPNKYLKKLVGPNTIIGNAYDRLVSGNLVSDVIERMNVGSIDDLVYSKIGKINNLILNNFSNSFLDTYGTNITENNKSKVFTQNPTYMSEGDETTDGKNQKNIKYQQTNIYNRNGF